MGGSFGTYGEVRKPPRNKLIRICTLGWDIVVKFTLQNFVFRFRPDKVSQDMEKWQADLDKVINIGIHKVWGIYCLDVNIQNFFKRHSVSYVFSQLVSCFVMQSVIECSSSMPSNMPSEYIFIYFSIDGQVVFRNKLALINFGKIYNKRQRYACAIFIELLRYKNSLIAACTRERLK